jgi:hypothetical protein
MKTRTESRTCDYCGKVCEEKDGAPVPVFAGWFTLELANGSADRLQPDCGPWDLCSTWCLEKFIAKEPR